MTPEEKAVLDALRISMQRDAEHSGCDSACRKADNARSLAYERKHNAHSDFLIAKQALRKPEQ